MKSVLIAESAANLVAGFLVTLAIVELFIMGPLVTSVVVACAMFAKNSVLRYIFHKHFFEED